MTAKLLESAGTKIAEQWVATLLTPAFVFWFGGFIIVVQSYGWSALVTQITHYPEPLQIALLIGGLCVITASAFVVQRFDRIIVRGLEGYWHPWLRPLWQYRIQHYRRHKQHLTQKSNEIRTIEANQRTRLQSLQAQLDSHGANSFSPKDKDEYLQLSEQLLTRRQQEMLIQLRQDLHEMPSNIAVMPTRLGNILRATEQRPLEKYGLDAIVCWSRLWLLLPDAVKQDLNTARADLNAAARIWLWSLLFTLWSGAGALWAIPLGLLSALFAYRWAIAAAQTYGDLIEASFDLYRHLLYQSLRWQLPSDPTEERRVGQQLTSYLWRG